MPRSASGARHGDAGPCRGVERPRGCAPARFATRRGSRPGARDVRRRRRARLGDDFGRAPGRSRHVTRPWPPGSATGIGSLPGTEIAEALRLAFDELPDLPHLPELPGRDLRRARDFLARDLDALERHADGYDGALKVQLVGPWTLAAGVELPSGHRVVSDHGAVRDLAAALGEGLRAHLADLAQRLPSASVVVQLDEPSIPAVLAAAVPTPSGFGTVRSVEASVVEQRLRDVLDVVPSGARVVHCCAAGTPIALLRGAGADAVSLDASLLGDRDIDA